MIRKVIFAALFAASFRASALAALEPAAAPASSCLLIGNSIAVGLGRVEPGCVLAAQNGITSDQVLALAPPDTGFTRVIVSMGSNDWRTRAPLADNLIRLRKLYPQARFVWLAPRRGRNAEIVADFARHHHDDVIKLGDLPSRDSTHPLDYADVAARLP